MRLYLHVGVGNDGAVDNRVDAIISTENEVKLTNELLECCYLHLMIFLILLLLLLLLFVLVLVLLFHKQL